MRINQFVASATGLSRRAADQTIAAGRVSINGRPAVLGDTATADDTISLDGQTLAPPATHTYLALNKPTGYVSSRTRQGTDLTLYELLPPAAHKLRLAGRLDRDSSGLMLLSDDGQFIQRYSHPSHNKIKVYELLLSHALTPVDHRRLQAGVTLTDGPSHVTVEHSSGRRVTVSLSEGRNRQLRRTFGALGYTVKKLHRTHIGPYHLGNLKPGAWQEITPQ